MILHFSHSQNNAKKIDAISRDKIPEKSPIYLKLLNFEGEHIKLHYAENGFIVRLEGL